MGIFEIEKDYQRHKKRLLEIRCTDCRSKVTHETGSNREGLVRYRRNKMQAELFCEREKTDRIAS